MTTHGSSLKAKYKRTLLIALILAAFGAGALAP